MEDFYEVRTSYPIKDWRIDTEFRIVYADKFIVIEKDVKVWHRTSVIYHYDVDTTEHIVDIVSRNYEALRAPDTFSAKARTSIKLADEFYSKVNEALTAYVEKTE